MAYSLAHLTVIDQAPPAMVRLAARAGYDRVGLRLIRVTDTSPGYPLMDDPAMLRETRAALDETGVRVLDIEFVKITPEIDVAALAPFMAVGAALGARHVITAPYDPELGRMAERLAAGSARAAEPGLSAVLEFFPWTCVPDLASAISLVEAVGREDLGILVDTLHFNRSGSDLADIARVSPGRFPYVHVCDALVQPSYTMEELLHAGRAERLPPGEGEIDIRSIVSALPPGIPVALEVPMTAMAAAEGGEAVARRVRQAAGRLLGS